VHKIINYDSNSTIEKIENQSIQQAESKLWETESKILANHFNSNQEVD
jgi:hypothetical protein